MLPNSNTHYFFSCRPLAGCLKNLPCKLDSVETLLPYLTTTSRCIISDDSSGFLHIFLHPSSQKLCGMHLGNEKFVFTSMPFGVTTG